MPTTQSTPLTPEELAAQIYKAEVNTTAYDGISLIEIHCSGRNQRTTDEEKQLLTANGYVEMFDYLVVGWDMWARPQDFPDKDLPIKL